MIKPNALRTALTAAIPLFAANPDMLKMWVDKGRIVAIKGASNRAFEYRYTLNLVIENWQGEECAVFLALNEWLGSQQPDLLAPAQVATGAYSFEADIIDDKTIDLSIDVQLSEAVRVVARAGGGFELTFAAEEIPLFAELQAMSAPPAPLTEIYWQGERMVPGPPLQPAP